ncbi:hypothetical protein N9W89_14385 [Hellea sp.]|nr:hypothetical protein [Hellea sp.]
MTQKTKSRKPLIASLIILAIIVVLLLIFVPNNRPADPPSVTPPVTPPVTTPVDPPATPPATPTPPDVTDTGRIEVQGLEVGMSSEDAEQLIERLLKPETSEGNQTFNVRRTPQTAAGYSLVATANNMLDDSVKAQEIVALFKPGSRDSFVLGEYSSRVKCHRGENTTEWTTQLCP